MSPETAFRFRQATTHSDKFADLFSVNARNVRIGHKFYLSINYCILTVRRQNKKPHNAMHKTSQNELNENEKLEAVFVFALCRRADANKWTLSIFLFMFPIDSTQCRCQTKTDTFNGLFNWHRWDDFTRCRPKTNENIHCVQKMKLNESKRFHISH